MDIDKVKALVDIASTADGIARAHAIAIKAWLPFPHNGCAANLSALLQLAHIDVQMTLGAGRLAHRLRDQRGWAVVPVGKQEAGDVGVTYDEGGNPGADHIYLVTQVLTKDEMVISDNQDKVVHHRFASGKGKTPTEYFLRAT